MMRFTTASGSLYEVDFSQKRIRRLSGKNDPTPRQGADGEWKVYEEISSFSGVENEMVIGSPAIIVWNKSSSNMQLEVKTTLTSDIVSIESDAN